MINQQPSGHGATVAVRVVRVRSTVTCGAAGAAAAAEATPSSNTTWLTSVPLISPLAVLTVWVPAVSARGSQVVTSVASIVPPAGISSPTGWPSMRSRVSSQCSSPSMPTRGGAIDGDVSSRIETGSVVGSPKRRSIVVAAWMPVTVRMNSVPVIAEGMVSVLRPSASGAGTVRSNSPPRPETCTAVIVECCASSVCCNVSSVSGELRGTVSVEPTASVNGEVQAVWMFPSAA